MTKKKKESKVTKFQPIIEVSEPTHDEAVTLTQEDVWGKFIQVKGGGHKKISKGMIIADSRTGGFDDEECQSIGICPIFKDHIPYKSVTVVCEEDLANEVAYWLEYVQGGDCISQTLDIIDAKTGKTYLAIRADYQCW